MGGLGVWRAVAVRIGYGVQSLTVAAKTNFDLRAVPDGTASSIRVTAAHRQPRRIRRILPRIAAVLISFSLARASSARKLLASDTGRPMLTLTNGSELSNKNILLVRT